MYFLCCYMYILCCSMYTLCCSMYFCVVLCIVCFDIPCVVCICVLNNCHRVATQLQLNISYHIHIFVQYFGFVIKKYGVTFSMPV
jgi:hypothetical protein